MKFGGASVAEPKCFIDVARIIAARRAADSSCQLVVVVSAMQGVTDQLIGLAHQVSKTPASREYDMLVSTGERVSIALLAMALSDIGQKAVSFTGSQSGIITDGQHSEARIVDVRPQRILEKLSENSLVIVAGFQGVSQGKEITTLGRGGSDTSAVALAIALGAECVEFYKDVGAIYTHDPKKVASATPFKMLSYKEALALVEAGAKVLHPRCVHLAARNGIELRVMPIAEAAEVGTCIGKREACPKVYESSAC